jgi:hypothetical protein
METGIHPFHMGMFLSPFPYGNHHMETGNCFIQLPIWKQGSPYGNGDLHITVTAMATTTTIKQQSTKRGCKRNGGDSDGDGDGDGDENSIGEDCT